MHSNHRNIKNSPSHNTNSIQSKNKHEKQHNRSSWRVFLPLRNEESKAKISWIKFSSTLPFKLNFPSLKDTSTLKLLVDSLTHQTLYLITQHSYYHTLFFSSNFHEKWQELSFLTLMFFFFALLTAYKEGYFG
jgi:hypothetical protein